MNNFSVVNEPNKCVMLLDRLNNVITTLYQLSEVDHYLDYIFNQSSTISELLEREGFTEDYFDELAERFEYLRSIVFGDQIDWHGLVNYEAKLLLDVNRKEIADLEDEVMKLRREVGKA
jgi:hypothetical protein